MPGSPPISTSDPGTTPPPRTRLNSSPGTIRRGYWSDCTSGRATGRARPSARPGLIRPCAETDTALETLISVKVFHAPQSGQRPCHLGDSLPHSWQTYMVRVWDLGGMIGLSGSGWWILDFSLFILYYTTDAGF